MAKDLPMAAGIVTVTEIFGWQQTWPAAPVATSQQNPGQEGQSDKGTAGII
ncbi:MAG: hypothetical protein NC548_02135 [Lachnospiraceae bacterium]|nr:hypothetical protein [Lachnospiraceae bacterium]